MFSLLNEDTYWLDQPDFRHTNTEWRHTHWAQDTYSEQLLDLVTKCIEWRPSDRIEAQALHEAIIAAIVGMENRDMEEYVVKAMLGRQQRNAQYDVGGAKQDKYRIGFALGKLAEEEASDPSETMNLDGLGFDPPRDIMGGLGLDHNGDWDEEMNMP